MHDLEDPQDQPQCDFARGSGRLASREEEADLSTLDDGALSTEAKREALRDQRLERRLRADQAIQLRRKAAFEIGKQTTLLGVLLLAAGGSMAVTICGLATQDADNVKTGLLGLCGIAGGTLYQLGLRS